MWVSPWKLRIPGACARIDLAARNVLKLRGQFFISAEWSKQREIGLNLAEMTITELDESLGQFYAEARNKEEEKYSRATLLSFRNGIERFLNSPPNSRGISLTNDPSFFSPTRCWTQK